MVTFIFICFILAVIGFVVIGALAAFGLAFSAAAVVALDVIVGLLPFIGIFMLIKWLLTRKSGKETKDEG